MLKAQNHQCGEPSPVRCRAARPGAKGVGAFGRAVDAPADAAGVEGPAAGREAGAEQIACGRQGKAHPAAPAAARHRERHQCTGGEGLQLAFVTRISDHCRLG